MTEQLTSFRLEFEVFPKRDAILDWYAEKWPQVVVFPRLTKKLVSAKRWLAGSPSRNGFRFVWFKDRLSGFSMTWYPRVGVCPDMGLTFSP
jgi:hypothetical protein